MFFRDLQPKTGVQLNVTLAEAHVPVRLGHRDASAIFAEPLAQQLSAVGLGVVTGYDTRAAGENEVAGVTLFLGLTDTSRESLTLVARMLEGLAAPCGSSIRLSDAISDPVMFGTTEGLELSIETNAAPDAERRRDLVHTCRDAMQDIAVSRGWARREERTLFYFYGESYEDMRQSLLRILKNNSQFASAALRRMA